MKASHKCVLIEICIGTSCHLMGAQDLLSLVDYLPENLREQIHVKTVPCLGGCEHSPTVRINGQIYKSMTPDKLCSLIKVSLTNSY